MSLSLVVPRKIGLFRVGLGRPATIEFGIGVGD